MILRNLFNFARTNKKIFFMFMLVQTATVIAFFSVFNYAMKFAEDMKSVQTECRTYSVEVYNPENIGSQMKKMYEKYSGKLLSLFAVAENGKDTVRCEYIYDSCKNVMNGTGFDKNDFYSGKKQILGLAKTDISQEKKYYIGSSYRLSGSDYEIIGTTLSDYIIVPFYSVQDLSNVSKVSIVLNCDIDGLEYSNFINNVKNIFETDNVNTPEPYSMGVYSETINYVMVFGIIIFIAVINIVYLYSYIMNKRRRETAVLRICGCSMNSISLMYLAETVFTSAVSYIIAMLCHLLLVMPFMMKLTNTVRYYITPLQFAIIYAVYLAVEIVVFVPVIQKISRTSPSVLNKE